MCHVFLCPPLNSEVDSAVSLRAVFSYAAATTYVLKLIKIKWSENFNFSVILSIIQVLSSHLWLVATMLNRADIEYFHHDKVLLDRAAFEDFSGIRWSCSQSSSATNLLMYPCIIFPSFPVSPFLALHSISQDSHPK